MNTQETKVSPNDASSGVSEEVESKDQSIHESEGSDTTGSSDTNDRLLRESKNWKSRAKQTESELDKTKRELEELRQARLQAEGKKDELIESLRKQNSDLDTKLKSAVGSFAKGKALDVISDEAVKMGCVSSRLVKKMVEDQLEELDYDDSFNPDREQVKGILEQIKQDEPFLFSRQGPKVADHNLSSKPVGQKAEKNLKKMSEAELLEFWKKQQG